MSDMRVVGRTYYNEDIYEGDTVISTPRGDLVFPEDLERYVLDADDYDKGEILYEDVQKDSELRIADMITDMKRGEGY